MALSDAMSGWTGGGSVGSALPPRNALVPGSLGGGALSGMALSGGYNGVPGGGSMNGYPGGGSFMGGFAQILSQILPSIGLGLMLADPGARALIPTAMQQVQEQQQAAQRMAMDREQLDWRKKQAEQDMALRLLGAIPGGASIPSGFAEQLPPMAQSLLQGWGGTMPMTPAEMKAAAKLGIPVPGLPSAPRTRSAGGLSGGNRGGAGSFEGMEIPTSAGTLVLRGGQWQKK